MFSCCSSGTNPERTRGAREEEEVYYFGPPNPNRVPPTVPKSLKEWKLALEQQKQQQVGQDNAVALM